MTQLNNVSDLPLPDHQAEQQSVQLLSLIKETIQDNHGVIPFDEYMSRVLYEPGLGYYSAGSRKFGEGGDFVTAPEISPLFSQCLARQCLQIIRQLDAPIILELGAGSGVMASDILLELQEQNALPESYWILEVSADLKQRQQTLLKERVPFFYENIVWLEQLPQTTFDGVILANEVVDALPVKRFIKKQDGFAEQAVTIKDNALAWSELPVPKELDKQLNELEQGLGQPLPTGYVSELNINLQDWLRSIIEPLRTGVILVFDYGYSRKEYYHPERSDGTLLCYYRHRAHVDPFFYPGLQDITASVDFTRLAECADALELHVNGYTTQAYFLMATGLDELSARLTNADIKQRTLLAQQLKTLTLPAEMGEQIKVMALTRDFNESLQGFSLMDQRVRL